MGAVQCLADLPVGKVAAGIAVLIGHAVFQRQLEAVAQQCVQQLRVVGDRHPEQGLGKPGKGGLRVFSIPHHLPHGPLGTVLGTLDHSSPEALLAIPCTAAAELVVSLAALFIQEEGPFFLLALTHFWHNSLLFISLVPPRNCRVSGCFFAVSFVCEPCLHPGMTNYPSVGVFVVRIIFGTPFG